MNRALYMDDMNLKEFEATVESIKDDKFVVLDQTAFYPLSGGVSYDTGVLIKNGEEFPVVYVWKFGEVISHEVSKQGLKEGDKVTGKIDWDRRYKLMRLHTTAHLIAAIMHNKAGALITGGKIEPDKARMDFSLEDFDREKIDEYIKLANELVQKDAKINVGYMKKEDALKIPDMIKSI